MNNSGRVRARQRRRDLQRNVYRFIDGQRRMHHLLTQRFAIDEFGSDKVGARVGANFVNGENIRMIQSRGGLSFLNKALHAQLVGSYSLRQNLQGHLAIERGVLRQIHFTHSAFAQLRADFVAAKFCADWNGGTHSLPTFRSPTAVRGF